MKSVRIALSLVLALGVAFAAGCSDKGVAAKVNGEKILLADVDKQVEQIKQQYPQMFQGPDGEGRLIDYKQRILDNLINQKLVEQAAKERRIEVSDEEVEKQLKALRGGFKDEEQFQAALKSANMTLDGLKKQIREQLLTTKIIESLAKDIKVTEDEMRSYYEKNKAQFEQKAAKRASHILFKPEDKKKAEQVLAELRSGGDFAALAKEYSVDPQSAAKGGDLGWQTTPLPEIDAALAKLDKGELSGLVKTSYGWHILRVTDTRKAMQQSFEQVKEQVKQILIQQKRADSYQKFIDELRKKAKIEILIDELKPTAATAPEKGASK